MAYYFRIHKGTEAQNARTGWNRTEVITDNNTGIQSIDDTMDQIPASGKVGTSIPTPLARIYLFDAAFEALKTSEVRNKTYEQLISDCFDLLQFLFEKGQDSKLKFYDIKIGDAVRSLRNSSLAGDQVLADSLELAVSGSDDFTESIFVIEYDGVVLGGTSPFTMVYTSPNVRSEIRRIKGMREDLMSNQKKEFFGQSITRLEDRPKEFRKYLQSLYNKVTGDAPKAAKLPFFKYVENKLGVDECRIDNYSEIYPAIKNAAGAIISNRYSELSYGNLPFDASGSDFLMKPTLNCGRPPLVLPKEFVPSQSQIWTYVDSPWNENTRILDADCNSEIAKRKLPKNGGDSSHESSIQYPWVSNCDFFNDNLLDLGYAINTDKFFYPACAEEVSFLLPIKKTYFDYFTIEDLKNNLLFEQTVTEEKTGNRVVKKAVEVKFQLSIPLKSAKGSIVLERIYRRKDDSDYCIKSVRNPMGLGIFPFYKITNGADAVRKQGAEYCGVKNEYAIYLFNTPCADNAEFKPSLKFYNCEMGKDVLAVGKERTRNAAGISTVYSIRPDAKRENNLTTFDFIEIGGLIPELGDNAILVPLLKEVTSSSNRDKKAVLAVDFGTSNTHAAYWDYATGKPQPLKIGKEDPQMVLLNKPWKDESGVLQYRAKESLGRAAYMDDFLREFVPPVIGDDTLRKGVSYPVKTATLQGKKPLSAPTLFGDVNIGYDIDNEEVKLTDDFNYKTNLKWAYQENRADVDARVRVHMFCEETLWLLKNVIVLKGLSNSGIALRYFYPESMMPRDKKLFKEEWENCCNEIFTNCGFELGPDDVKAISESVAPYYSLLRRNGDLLNYNSINIDIGGGTTDIFLFDRGMDQGMNLNGFDSSVLFAANDIWGRTYPSTDNPKNGFVMYMEDIVKNWGDERKELKNLYENVSIKDPASLASFFFKHDKFGFGTQIENVSEFKFLLFLHYASIIYYVTDMIECVRDRKLSEFQFPRVLTFTGKGSEYIKLLTPEPDSITRLTQALFNAFGISRDELGGFKVQYPDNPKTLTADGGIYSCMASEVRAKFVSEEDRDPFAAQESSTKECVYRQIGKYLTGLGLTDCESLDIKGLKTNTPHYKELIMNKFGEFVKCVFDSEILREIAKKIGINIVPEYEESIINSAKESLDKHLYKYLDEHKDNETDKVEGTLFFLALKNSIITMSYDFYKKMKNGK